MAAAGVELLADSSALAVGGLFEVAGSFGRIASVWRAMLKGLRDLQPDLVVLVDSGGFNLPFARRVRQLTSARVLYFIAPQLWAWRAGRLSKLVRRTDRIAVLFPFERDFYAARGVDVDYVGHPLLDSVFAEPVPEEARAVARRALGLGLDRPVLALLPGSRRNEVARHLPLQLAALACLRRRFPELADVQAVVGVAPSLGEAELRGLLRDAGQPDDVRIAAGGVGLFDAADVALTKPGTITVQLMLRRRPMVVIGRIHPLSAVIVRRGLQVPWLAMPNLIAGAAIVPELMQADATPDRIADELAPLFAATTERPNLRSAAEEQISALTRARDLLGPAGATARVADLIKDMLSIDANRAEK